MNEKFYKFTESTFAMTIDHFKKQEDKFQITSVASQTIKAEANTAAAQSLEVAEKDLLPSSSLRSPSALPHSEMTQSHCKGIVINTTMVAQGSGCTWLYTTPGDNDPGRRRTLWKPSRCSLLIKWSTFQRWCRYILKWERKNWKPLECSRSLSPG